MSTSDCVSVSAACSKPEKNYEWKAAGAARGQQKAFAAHRGDSSFSFVVWFWVAASQK